MQLCVASEPDTSGEFKLNDNYPNPFSGKTIIPFILKNSSTVKIELYDRFGCFVEEILNQQLNAGEHTAVIQKYTTVRMLEPGKYTYQFSVKNHHGTFGQTKIIIVE